MTTSFTYSPKMELVCNDGPGTLMKVAKANLAAGGKRLIDDYFVNDDVIDVGAVCAALTVPTYVQIKCANQGVKFNWDTLGYSIKVTTGMLVEIRPDGTGPLDLLLKAQGPSQRIEVLIVGEP